MKIAIPIAAYEEGTTGEYVVRAFRQLGHQADILSQWDFYREFKANTYDLYFCVDSGGPLNLLEFEIAIRPMRNLCFWMIDYRRGKTLKNPNDYNTCKLINSQGGWVFQSQFEDFIDCMNNGIERVSWLPLAADPDVWNSQPHQEKVYDIGFVGNVWDPARQEALDSIARICRLGFMGHGAARMESGAHVLRSCRAGFNISSFYTEPIAYDVNMRVFETLSCGIPLITNYVPSLDKIFEGQPFIKTYQRGCLQSVVMDALSDEKFLSSGDWARDWAMTFGTYKLRMEQALTTLKAQGMV